MENDPRLPEESMKRIEDHFEKMEAEIEQRVQGMKNQAMGASVVKLSPKTRFGQEKHLIFRSELWDEGHLEL